MSFSFGSTTTAGGTTPSQGFAFGGGDQKPLFGGANAENKPTFNFTSPTTTAQTFGGFAFGAKTTAGATSLFSTPATTQAVSAFGASKPLSFVGFQSPPPNQTVGSPSFGQPVAQNAAQNLSFGGTAATQQPTPTFGTPPTQATQAQAPAFGSPAGTGLFAAATSAPSGFAFATPASGFSAAPAPAAQPSQAKPTFGLGPTPATSAPAFSQSSAFGKPGGFGLGSFTASTTTAAAPAFGTTPPTFGQPTSAGPTQASLNFGTTASNAGTTAPNLGTTAFATTFGAGQAKPSFLQPQATQPSQSQGGFGFGTTQAATPALNFATSSTASLNFSTPAVSSGTPATSAQTGLTFATSQPAGLTFGTSAPSSTTSAAFGASSVAPTTAFGTSSVAPSTASAFGTTASVAPSTASAFGTPPSVAPSTASAFGTSASVAPSTASAFGTSSSVAPSTAGFGTLASSAPSTFGTPASLATTAAGISFGAVTSAPTFGTSLGTSGTTGVAFGKPLATTAAASVASTSASGGISLIGKSTALTAPALTTATTTTASTPPQPFASISYAQLEENMNKWTLELEEQEKTFINQATQINAWDRLLIANGEKIVELNEAVQTVKNEQQGLELELDFVVGQQRELEDLLAPLETLLLEDSGDRLRDPEREHMYSLAENLDTQLRQMSEDLKEVIEHLNETNRSQDSNDPIVQIGRILNAHMSSMQWIDNSIALISTKLDQLKASHDTLRRDNERSFQLTYN